MSRVLKPEYTLLFISYAGFTPNAKVVLGRTETTYQLLLSEKKDRSETAEPKDQLHNLSHTSTLEDEGRIALYKGYCTRERNAGTQKHSVYHDLHHLMDDHEVDEYISRVTKFVEGARRMVEVGFEYVTEFEDGLKLFGKPKS